MDIQSEIQDLLLNYAFIVPTKSEHECVEVIDDLLSELEDLRNKQSEHEEGET